MRKPASIPPEVLLDSTGYRYCFRPAFIIGFYGSSFIADQAGEKVAEAGRDEDAVLVARFDLDETRRFRDSWGLFRDRRPDLYAPLLTLDGEAE